MTKSKYKFGVYDHWKIRGRKKGPLSTKIRRKISRNRKGKALGNKNGLGKNLNNKNAFGKVRKDKNGNWKGGKRTLEYREKLAGRSRPEYCEICGAMGRIDFDHDHLTGIFRGWICRRCNLVLGLVKDNSELLVALSNYLQNVSIH
jgi:hypothetical protein